ncbi:SH3 domain-containing protein [Terriglobus roseus]|nr:SH3 domain-containing protein [Terriglobus roseus]
MRKLASIFLLTLPLIAQKRPAPPPDAQRATVVKVADVYVAPDAQSQRVSVVTPGHEVLIVERSGPWVKVFANTDIEEEKAEEEPEFTVDPAVLPRSGWIRDKGIVGPTTPNGDKLIYGEAASMEAAAGEPHAPKSAAGAAHLLYRRVAEYFPSSSLAGEAQWRAADIRWQEEKFDASTLPSAKDMDANMRPALYQKDLQKIVKTGEGKYPALAAYDLLDSKLCGDWQGLPKCPEMESNLYQKYADTFPDGPKTAQALWQAVYRQGVLVTMYTTEENKKRADAASQRAHVLRDTMVQHFPASDYTARAVSLVYRVEQGIAIYGSDRD